MRQVARREGVSEAYMILVVINRIKWEWLLSGRFDGYYLKR
jgi:hypothetical protein